MLDQLADSGLTMTTDMWFDRASGRIVEIVASGTSNSDERDAFEVTVTFGEPDPSINFAPPAVVLDVPLVELFSNFLGGFGDPFDNEWDFDDDDWDFEFDDDFEFEFDDDFEHDFGIDFDDTP